MASGDNGKPATSFFFKLRKIWAGGEASEEDPSRRFNYRKALDPKGNFEKSHITAVKNIDSDLIVVIRNYARCERVIKVEEDDMGAEEEDEETVEEQFEEEAEENQEEEENEATSVEEEKEKEMEGVIKLEELAVEEEKEREKEKEGVIKLEELAVEEEKEKEKKEAEENAKEEEEEERVGHGY